MILPASLPQGQATSSAFFFFFKGLSSSVELWRWMAEKLKARLKHVESGHLGRLGRGREKAEHASQLICWDNVIRTFYSLKSWLREKTDPTARQFLNSWVGSCMTLWQVQQGLGVSGMGLLKPCHGCGVDLSVLDIWDGILAPPKHL